MTLPDDSLIQGLRTLTLLAHRGPLDLSKLARMNGWRVERTAAVVDVLQRAGLVRRVVGRGSFQSAFAVTPRAAALVRAALVKTGWRRVH